MDESQAEASKEHKLRERLELFTAELEREMEELKRGRRSLGSNAEVSQELNRLVNCERLLSFLGSARGLFF